MLALMLREVKDWWKIARVGGSPRAGRGFPGAFWRSMSLVLAFAWLAVGGRVSALELWQPYAADEFTLHLWHLDETGPPFADNGLFPCPLLGLQNKAQAGQSSVPGLGNAVYFNTYAGGEPQTLSYQGGILLAVPHPDRGAAANVKAPFPIMGKDGQFTFEATVKLACLPDQAPGRALDVMTMDGEDPNRVFLLRIEKPNFLSFLPIYNGHVTGGAVATLPQTGPDALNTNDWFHLAVSYDGRPGVNANLKLYWTRVRPGLASAHLVGLGSLPGPLSRQLARFAIGNSARTKNSPFPGLIDEVRISSIAREPFDFHFVAAEIKARARARQPAATPPPPLQIILSRVLVDSVSVPLTATNPRINIGPGRHRLDIDFDFQPAEAGPLAVCCRLEGLDDHWQPVDTGMEMTCEALDSASNVISRAVFPAPGTSSGWRMDLTDSSYSRRQEPFFLPDDSRFLRITLSAGTPDTTGCFAINDLSVTAPGLPPFWDNGTFTNGERLETVTGVPDHWQRSGSEPAIAQVTGYITHSLLLVDADRTKSAAWTSVQPLPAIPPGGLTATLRWSEAYNVISGSAHRVTYINIPPGKYVFRAIAIADGPYQPGTQLTLPVSLQAPLWEHPWFLAVTISTFVTLAALLVLQEQRRRANERIARSRFQHTLERDRARIARDLHDDLGTRISALSMNAAFVGRDLDKDPRQARQRIPRLEASCRELVTAMDGLVWALNPANDTLDHLASHLASLAEELFRDSPTRLRLAIPADLPALPVRSDFRHHFALAVKEALNNSFKHSRAREVKLTLRLEELRLVATVADDGVGFDPARRPDGNGLHNLAARLAELDGECSITAAPGAGVRVVFHCPVPPMSA